MNEESLIAVFSTIFYTILNYSSKKAVSTALFDRNVVIYGSFKNVFVNNIILLNILLYTFKYTKLNLKNSINDKLISTVHVLEIISSSLNNIILSMVTKSVIMF